MADFQIISKSTSLYIIIATDGGFGRLIPLHKQQVNLLKPDDKLVVHVVNQVDGTSQLKLEVGNFKYGDNPFKVKR